MGGPRGGAGAAAGPRVQALPLAGRGPVTIGSRNSSRALAVVIRSAPDRAVVAGNPGRVLSYDGSFELIQYPDITDDPERQRSLETLRAPDNPSESVAALALSKGGI